MFYINNVLKWSSNAQIIKAFTNNLVKVAYGIYNTF